MLIDLNIPHNLIFNLTTLERSKRHENFVTDIREPTCALVQALPLPERCDYVRSMKQCEESAFLFNYVTFYYCYLSQENPLMDPQLIFCIFCPSLKVLSKILGMSETIAGVTLLAFGNSSPDLFTSLTGLSGESRRIYSDIYGSSIFVAVFIGGVIVTSVPFTTLSAAYLREMGFFMFGIFFIEFAIVTAPGVTVTEGICTLSIYLIYIIILLTDQFLVKRETKLVQEELNFQNLKGAYSSKSISALKSLKSEAVIEVYSRERINPLGTGRSEHRVVDKNERFYEKYDKKHQRNYQLFIQLKEAVLDESLDINEFKESNLFWKCCKLIRAPILFALLSVIPVIDYEQPKNGWSKLLNCIQIVLCPSCLLFFTMGLETYLYLPLFVWVCFITVPISIWVFLVTRTDIPPKAHDCFSILGVLGSVFVIYATAAETNAVLDVIGITTYRSNSFLGCTILGWGNSIGDLVANLALARQGYEKMGFAACYGGPMFNTLIAIGSTFVYKAWNSYDQVYRIAKGTMGENCFVFLSISLPCILLGAVSTNFVMRRCLGLLMMMFYIIFFFYCFLGELEIVHTYGSDHSLDLKVDPVFE